MSDLKVESSLFRTSWRQQWFAGDLDRHPLPLDFKFQILHSSNQGNNKTGDVLTQILLTL